MLLVPSFEPDSELDDADIRVRWTAKGFNQTSESITALLDLLDCAKQAIINEYLDIS